jgi:hypothetical protein
MESGEIIVEAMRIIDSTVMKVSSQRQAGQISSGHSELTCVGARASGRLGIGQQSAGQTSGRGPSTPSAALVGFSSIRSQINSRIIRTNLGCVPTVLALTIRKPNCAQSSAASVSRSNSISMWSETKPTGEMTTSRVPPCSLICRRHWRMSGSSQGGHSGSDRRAAILCGPPALSRAGKFP